jgi:hypothetical protein
MAKKIVPLRDAPRQDDAGAAEWKPAPRPTWMSDTEARLYDELVTTTRKLAKRGVPVSYSVIAEVAEDMERAHREGRSALPAIAEGLDTMRDVERQHRASIVAHRKKVINREEYQFAGFVAIVAGLVAVACLLAGINTGDRTWFYCSAFAVVFGGAFLLPVIFSLRNR